MQINWSNILVNSGATVEFFNTNWHGAAPRTDSDIALFSFPNNIHVELQWNRATASYFVTLYEDDFKLLHRVSEQNASDAVMQVKCLSGIASQLASGRPIQLSSAEAATRTAIRCPVSNAAMRSVRLEAGAR